MSWSRFFSNPSPSPYIADSSVAVMRSTIAGEPVAKPIGRAIPRDFPSTIPDLPDEYERIADRLGASHLVAHVKQARHADAEAIRLEDAVR